MGLYNSGLAELETTMKLTTLVLMAAALAGLRQEVKPPDLPAHAAVRPVAHLKSGVEHRAGTGVIARVSKDGPLLLLTALHIFGPSGGLKKQISSATLDDHVAKVDAESLDGKIRVATASGSKIRNGFPIDAKNNCSGDVAAFAVQGKAETEGLLLAEALPKAGDPLWLVGDEAASDAPTQKLWAMKVESAKLPTLILNAEVRCILRAFSGAPLVDASGRMAGLLIGADDPEPKAKTRIYAISAVSIRKRLEESR